jgi:hypothetical protein
MAEEEERQLRMEIEGGREILAGLRRLLPVLGWLMLLLFVLSVLGQMA